VPGINRKLLAEQLAPAGAEAADLEKAKMTLVSDLHWLIREGYVIEFNDGSLDLPRSKPPVTPTADEGRVAMDEAKPSEVMESPASEATADAPPVEESESESIPAPQGELSASEGPPQSVSASADELVAREQT